MSLEWDEQTRILIDERKNGNVEYHQTPKRNKRLFWEKIAEKLNQTYNTNYFTREDCNKKFLTLTRAYYTAKAYKEAVAEAVLKGPANVGVKKKRSLVGEHYYEEFSTEFWKEPGTQRPTTSYNTDRQSSSENLNPFEIGSDTSSSPSHKKTKSSRPVTPSIETPVVSRPVTPTLPSFSQNANVINVTINYGGAREED
ncbi:hypothetical protein C1645_882821 [Glomus cerebriforme]|uniref:Uncharacterized protein n=1 Tax=Glomus cerebriforme TaxID=658196 RepID=A0A397RXZ5_9GLOM|nr:hypothetical protein C1645_882821 [Glomus cerebriforme]